MSFPHRQSFIFVVYLIKEIFILYESLNPFHKLIPFKSSLFQSNMTEFYYKSKKTMISFVKFTFLNLYAKFYTQLGSKGRACLHSKCS